MQIRTLALGLAALAFTAACGENGHPLDTDVPPAAQAVQALDCVVPLDGAEMRCDSPAPGLGGARGAILGGQNNLVVLSSAGLQTLGDTLQLDVTVRNLMDQALGTRDGETLAGGVRVFFAADPVSQPGGIPGEVANASGMGWFTGNAQPYFEYAQVLRPDSVTPPIRWQLVYAPGASSVSFRVYVQAPVQFEDSRNGAAAADSARNNGVRLLLAGGGGQSAAPGATLADSVRVRVVDGDGDPVPNAILNFLPQDGGSASPRQTRTDASGYASAAWTLGPDASTQSLRVAGVGGTIVVTASAGTATGGVLRLTPDSLRLQVGASAQLTASLLDGAGVGVPPGDVAWSSSSPTIATVSAGGVVTGVAPGRAVITAQVAGLTATATVEVTPAPAPRAVRLRIDPASIALTVGASTRVRAIAEDASGNPVTGLAVRWVTLDSTIARLDTGFVSGRKVGTTQIRALVDSLVAQATVTVSPSPSTNTGPTFGGIQILDGPYPVRPGDRLTIQFWSVQDPDGVAAVRLTARAPDGVQTASCNLTRQDGAPDWNALWSCDLPIPPNAGHGTWTLDPISARDKLGNVTTHTGAEMLARRYPPDIQFFVENLAYDRVAPVLTGLTLSLESAPTGHWLVARFTATDVGSGIDRTGIEIASPGGSLSRINTCSADSVAVSHTSGTWTCRVIAPTAEVNGEIVVVRIGLSDRADNYTNVTTEDLQARGLPSRIAVP
ncbi:Ig-like domain-containing protein [Longimicrobium sp.]|uniref:Ig-like domain-containing protein n=1 Tax=Longimicrobium sp. TaxID=2029185 RepID=UPI002E33B321|nr:Ig-like domain-containing protein [Longimicrobium sp.]HEX6039526.1 Ig-like domain-containing protein [Longimicrobium sp.]